MFRLPIKPLVFFLVFVICAGVSYWSFFSSHDATTESTKTLVEESMSGVHTKKYDKTGHLHQVIAMEKWEHLKGDTITSMQAPSLILYYPDGKICKISADLGEGFHADLKGPLEKLHLMKNVAIQQMNEQSTEWELKTTSIIYFPSSQTAMTDDWVTVLSASTILQSQGMKVYLEKQRVEFMNQVTSQYAKST